MIRHQLKEGMNIYFADIHLHNTAYAGSAFGFTDVIYNYVVAKTAQEARRLLEEKWRDRFSIWWIGIRLSSQQDINLFAFPDEFLIGYDQGCTNLKLAAA